MGRNNTEVQHYPEPTSMVQLWVQEAPLPVGPGPGALGGSGIRTKMVNELSLTQGSRGILNFCSSLTVHSYSSYEAFYYTVFVQEEEEEYGQ